MNINISLSTSSVETVTKNLITKLYDLAFNAEEGDIISYLGNIYSTTAYEDEIRYLRDNFPNLVINVPESGLYIKFEDPEVERVLLANNIGDSTGVTKTIAGSANINNIFLSNTTITSFPEFKYFTNSNNNPTEYMFRDCTNLESIDLSNVTAINAYQFLSSGIKIVNAPNLILFLGKNAGHGCFTDSQVEEIVNLGHVSYIPDSAFRNCFSLESVVLPDECYELSWHSFRIDQAYVNSYGSVLQSIQGLNHINNFGTDCLYGHRGLLLTAEDIKEAVLIGEGAFWYTTISSINCKKLSFLGTSAFRENNALTTVECLGTINSMTGWCFMLDTALQTVKLPYECTSIGNSAFLGCSALTSVTQYDKSINDYEEGEEPVFTDLSKITSYGNSCFRDCSLLQINASEITNATFIDGYAFYKTGLYGTLNLPNLTDCGNYCFRETAIQTVSSLGSINYMPEGIFWLCNNLTSVTVTEPILEIKANAFFGCHNLTYFSDDLSNVTTLYASCFSANSSNNNMKFKENELVSFPSVTFISVNMFGQCHFKQLYMSSIATTYYGGNFRDWYTGWSTFGSGSNMHFYCDLMYFKDLQKMYPGAFCRISSYALVINNNTPPVWANNQDKSDDVADNTENDKKRMFCYSDFHTKKTSNKEFWPNKLDINVYVPASAVTAYQEDTLWNTYCTIHPISDLNSGVIYANETDWIAAGKPVGLVADKLGLSTADLATFVNANNLTYYVPSGS